MNIIRTVITNSMKTFALLAAAFLAGSAFGAEENAESFIRKSFTVAPGGKLTIRADRGSVDVKPGAGDSVQIEVKREPGRGTSEDILKKHSVTFAQEGNNVMVKGEMDPSVKGSFWRNNNLKVRYVVTLPKEFNVDLKTSGGSIAVEALKGEARSETSGGSLKFGQIDGFVFGRTSGGSINVSGAMGDVDVHTSGGGIQVGSASGNVMAKTSGGSIKVGDIKGALTAKTSGGGISVNGAAGPVNAQTSGGSIQAAITTQPTGDCKFETSGGGIEVKMVEKVAMDLDAHTSGGSVSTEFPVMMEGKVKNNELRGKLNGGGPRLNLATSGGSIRIRKL